MCFYFYRAKILKSVIFCFVILNAFLIIYYNSEYFTAIRLLRKFEKMIKIKEFELPCIIPKLNPFANEIISLVTPPLKFNCEDKHPLLFSTDINNNLIVLTNNSSRRYLQCCYRNFHRGEDADWRRVGSEKCIPIVNTNNTSKIPIRDEFISVHCINEKSNQSELVDAFGFVHLKPEMEFRIAKHTQNYESEMQKMNIVILGIDSVSHMNFIRTMKKSYTFLTNDLEGIGMNGYFTVGENSLPNFSAFLMGKSREEVDRGCYNETQHFDTCPFVWKNFSQKGFRTLFGEDAANIGTFNFARRGFEQQPTDYYLQTLFYYLLKLRSRDLPNVDSCYGPRYVFEIILDYIKKTATAFRKGEKYFQFIWSNTISHDFLNTPFNGDEFLFEFLKWFKKMNYFERTAFFLMSDHGQRIGPIRETYQGMLEARMPLLYAVFPKWFKEKYSTAILNFKRNSDRLTTPFDLYETFLDLSNYDESLSEKSTNRRSILLLEDQKRLPRGISLFLPIQKSRSCSQAGIPSRYCVCQYTKPVSAKNSESSALGVEMANAAIRNINDFLKTASEKCAILVLKTIKGFDMLETGGKNIQNDYNAESKIINSFLITFVTEPGEGVYETMVNRDFAGKWKTSIESINRINMYGNQSHCVNERTLKTFCYCL